MKRKKPGGWRSTQMKSDLYHQRAVCKVQPHRQKPSFKLTLHCGEMKLPAVPREGGRWRGGRRGWGQRRERQRHAEREKKGKGEEKKRVQIQMSICRHSEESLLADRLIYWILPVNHCRPVAKRISSKAERQPRETGL